MKIQRIEVDFAIPVEVSDIDMRRIDDVIQRIAKANQPDGMVHWCSGCGSKPNWSQADALFLGKTPDPNAPVSGEPTFDDSILHFETACREAYPGER